MNLGAEADIIRLPTFKQVLLHSKIFKNSFKDEASIPNSIFKVLSKSHCTLKTSSINKIHVESTNSWHKMYFYSMYDPITIILLLHCHDLKICLRIYWPSKMCIDHHLVLEVTWGVETPLCYHNKLLTTKLRVIISSSLLSFSLCSPSTLWAWSSACLLLSYTLTRWPWYASSPVQDKTTPAAIACYINLEHSPSFAL